MGKHSKGVSSFELSFEYRLNFILEELQDIEFDAKDAGVYAVAHKVEEGSGPLRSALIAARHLNREYGQNGVWT